MEDQRNFLQKTIFELLAKLRADSTAKWGLMSPQEMVEHLSLLMVVSYGKIKIPVFFEEERVQKNYKYTITKRIPLIKNFNPIGKGAVSPAPPLRFASLDKAVEKLKMEIGKFYAYFEANPDTKTVNPSLGPLSFEDWEYFHCKHFAHHLAQFGLLTEEEAAI